MPRRRGVRGEHQIGMPRLAPRVRPRERLVVRPIPRRVPHRVERLAITTGVRHRRIDDHRKLGCSERVQELRVERHCHLRRRRRLPANSFRRTVRDPPATLHRRRVRALARLTIRVDHDRAGQHERAGRVVGLQDITDIVAGGVLAVAETDAFDIEGPIGVLRRSPQHDPLRQPRRLDRVHEVDTRSDIAVGHHVRRVTRPHGGEHTGVGIGGFRERRPKPHRRLPRDADLDTAVTVSEDRAEPHAQRTGGIGHHPRTIPNRDNRRIDRDELAAAGVEVLRAIKRQHTDGAVVVQPRLRLRRPLLRQLPHHLAIRRQLQRPTRRRPRNRLRCRNETRPIKPHPVIRTRVRTAALIALLRTNSPQKHLTRCWWRHRDMELPPGGATQTADAGRAVSIDATTPTDTNTINERRDTHRIEGTGPSKQETDRASRNAHVRNRHIGPTT